MYIASIVCWVPVCPIPIRGTSGYISRRLIKNYSPCFTGPVVEGLADPGRASVDLVDGNVTTCLPVPPTPATPHHLKLRLGVQKIGSLTHTFSLVVKGVNLECSQKRTMVYGATVHAPEEVGVYYKVWKLREYRLCTLVSAEVLGFDVCTFACDCGTHCSSVYVSVVAEHPSDSLGTTELCEIEVI